MNQDDGQAEVWRMLDGSGPGRLVAAVAANVGRAGADSRALRVWRRLCAAWLIQPPVLRMRTIGATVLVATAVHVALGLTTHPAGAWWLIVPGIAAVFGAAAIGLSLAAGGNTGLPR
jgi:hypothetical protein